MERNVDMAQISDGKKYTSKQPMKAAFSLMRMADAAYIHSDRGYAGFFRLAGFMRMKVLAIFCR